MRRVSGGCDWLGTVTPYQTLGPPPRPEGTPNVGRTAHRGTCAAEALDDVPAALVRPGVRSDEGPRRRFGWRAWNAGKLLRHRRPKRLPESRDAAVCLWSAPRPDAARPEAAHTQQAHYTRAEASTATPT